MYYLGTQVGSTTPLLSSIYTNLYGTAYLSLSGPSCHVLVSITDVPCLTTTSTHRGPRHWVSFIHTHLYYSNPVRGPLYLEVPPHHSDVEDTKDPLRPIYLEACLTH